MQTNTLRIDPTTAPMTDRARFDATMHYGVCDRAPICDFGFWDETLIEWQAQGLPVNVVNGHMGTHTAPWFGMDSYGGGPAVNVGLMPAFDFVVLQDRGDHEVVQKEDGVRVLRKKYMSSIPHPEGYLLHDRESWQLHYKPRLEPDNPGRDPDFKAARAYWEDPARAEPAILWGGSLYGWLRDWMGFENLAMVVYDDPAWFEEMVETVADCIVAGLTRAYENGASGHISAVAMWEDMCYNAGPLLAPEHFVQFLVPHYRRITEVTRKHGTDIVWTDCDGKIDALLPHWLDAGINTMFPLEVGTWGGDPVRFRKEYGRDLRLMGGFDKHILALTPAEIDAEIQRLAPLVEEGGFIPFCDHRVPPDVPYANYLHYLRTARHLWGQDVHLKPMLAGAD